MIFGFIWRFIKFVAIIVALGLSMIIYQAANATSDMEKIIKEQQRCLQDPDCLAQLDANPDPSIKQIILHGPLTYTIFIWTYAAAAGMTFYAVVFFSNRYFKKKGMPPMFSMED